jgi:nucleotide-binding universal stress UspA family protein
MFKRILLASDGSEHALRATEKTISLTDHLTEVQVTIVYVIDSSTSKADVLSAEGKEAIEARRKERLAETEHLLREAEVSFETQVIRGEPGPSIVRYAQENDMDLVVIGSRGLNVLQEMVLGSVSHKIAKRTHCPVMIVK